MGCFQPKPIYRPHALEGCNLVAVNDGYTVILNWDEAFVSVQGYNLAYNIYYSTLKDNLFSEGPKFVTILNSDDNYPNTILDLTPGDISYFAVKATQHDPSWMNLALLQTSDNQMKVYPESILLSDMTEDDLIANISDVELFPAFGVVQIGSELMRYTSKDNSTNELIIAERGFLSTNIRLHQSDGYDGLYFQDPIVRFWKGFEDDNERIQLVAIDFRYPNYAFTNADGYSIKQDLITSNDMLSASDATTADFPSEDFVGFRRTTPSDLLSGVCVGSYYGGEIFCANGYLGINRQVRGVSLQDQASEGQAMLNVFGRPVVLVKRLWTGIRCYCINNTMERPAERCPACFSTGFQTGYEQFFNPRRSDGRILVRFDPADEDFVTESAGLESKYDGSGWTITFPTIKDYDFLIAFDSSGAEEFRYEIVSVTRNFLMENDLGAQKFKFKRVRKTDPIASWRAIYDTSTMPEVIHTGIGLLRAANNSTIPHSHTIVINENITSLSQINQTTSTDEGHSHEIRAGIVMPSIGNSHSLII